MTTPAEHTAAPLRVRQAILISLLLGSYASLYFCRADLAVATPLVARELVSRTMLIANLVPLRESRVAATTRRLEDYGELLRSLAARGR
ncbi:MAG: hypothetical protein ACREUL_13865 [Steroidobacteraceae bacterium]